MNYFFNKAKSVLLWILEPAKRNYYVARAYYQYKHRREQKKFKGPPLIIFQMGKVGSRTVHRSLKALNLDMPIYHSHLLTKNRIIETEKKRKKFFRTERQPYLSRPWLNRFLRKQIDKGLDGKKWKVITLTRDPVARNISTFFENLDFRTIGTSQKFEIRSNYYDIPATLINLDDLEKIKALFLERMNHNSPLEFFERELKGVFGIDIYQSAFPKSIGYKIYHDKIADVLVIRLENLNECAYKAFKEFLDIDNFSLIVENVSTDKIYADLYQKFKDSIVLPHGYIDKLYNSKYMRHFYSEEEINALSAKWFR
jgi:hypothetical protein